MKLTKAESKAHSSALALVQSGRLLTFEEREIVWRDFHPGHNHNITISGAFFTPVDAAWECAVLHGGGGRVIDFCAGIGVLGGMLWEHEIHSPHRPKVTCVEMNPEYYEIGRRVFPEADWVLGDAFDSELLERIGVFDSAISNPPFGRFKGRKGKLHIEALRVLTRITRNGAIVILPENSLKTYQEAIEGTKARIDFTATSLKDYKFSKTGVKCEMFSLNLEE